MIHVIPTLDLQPHTEETTCQCNPRVETEGEEILVVHNSFDGRESLEQAQSILNEESNQ